jgi:hypothetical protein
MSERLASREAVQQHAVSHFAHGTVTSHDALAQQSVSVGRIADGGSAP